MTPLSNSLIQGLNEIAETWWPQVFHATWQSAIVVVIALAFIRLGRRWHSPLRYAILLVALAKFTVPPLLSLPTGMLSQVPAKVPAPLKPLSSLFVPRIELAPTQPLSAIATGMGPERAALPSHWIPPILPPDGTKIPAVPSLPRASMSWKTYLMLIHLFGMVIVGAVVVLGFRGLLKCAKRAEPCEDEDVNELLTDLCRCLSLRRTPHLLLTDRETAPIAFGVWRPRIMISQCLVDRLPPGELRTVLAHELTHHRHRDPLVNCIQAFLSIVWWFNPFFWLLSSRIRKVREDRCDDLLLARNLTSSDSYTQALLRCARALAPVLPAGTSLGFAEKLHPVGRRIRRIMDPGLKRSTKISLAGLLLVVILAAFILPGLNVREEATEETASVGPVKRDPTARSDMENVLPPSPTAATDEIAKASPDQQGAMGYVVRQDGQPVAGCEVVFVPHADDALEAYVRRGRYRESEPFAVTDGSGEFSSRVLTPGEYTVTFRASGYAYAEYPSTVLVKAGEITRGINQTLENAGVIFGQVIKNVSGEPVKGARVVAQIVSRSRHHEPAAATHRNLTILTDSEGMFRFDSLFPHEKYDLIAHHEVYASATEKSVAVDTGKPVRMVVSLGGTIKGQVLRERDAAPVPDARITLALGEDVTREVRSATDGSYSIDGLDPGTYRLKAEKEGTFTGRLPEYEVGVGYAGETELTLWLVPGGVIELTVIDKETRKPIAEAAVRFSQRSETFATDRDGRVCASGFDEGEVKFTVTTEGYAATSRPEHYELWVRLGETFESTIELESDKALTGIVVDEQGKPVSGARVGVDGRRQGRWPDADGDWESVTTGGDGRFRLGGLGGGEYTYRVSAAKEGFAPARWEGSPYQKEEIRLVLHPGATLEGTVKDKEGKGQEGFTVELDGGPQEVTVLSGPEGRWKMEHIEAWDWYRIMAEKRNLKTNQLERIKVGWDDHLEGIELVVRERVTISGKVVDAVDGTGIPNIEVRFWTDPHITTRSDAAGNFLLEKVPWGTYEFYIKLPSPYMGLSRRMDIKVGSEDIEGVLLEAMRGATVRGKVLFPSGQGAPEAGLSLLYPENSVTTNIRGVKSDTEGRYEIRGIGQATGARVRADLPGYAPGISEKIDLPQGQVVEGVLIQLYAPGSVAGTVKDDQGNPLSEGYSVQCIYPFPEAAEHNRGAGILGRDNPGLDGHYVIGSLPPGEVLVRLWGTGRGIDGSPGWSSVRQSRLVTIEPGEETRGVDFTVVSK